MTTTKAKIILNLEAPPMSLKNLVIQRYVLVQRKKNRIIKKKVWHINPEWVLRLKQ